MVAKSAQTFEVKNPSTGAVLSELPVFGPDEVQAEVTKARTAGRAWAEKTVAQRCAALWPVTQAIARRTDELVETIHQENGKVGMDALSLDVGASLLVMNYFLENGPRILADEPIRLATARHRASYLTYRPKGVIGIITPWNFPFFMPAADVSMALIAGSAVVLKPSEVTPLSALLLKKCYDEAGVDPDLFRVVTGLGPTGAALIEAQPDHLVFTGAVATGRRVGVACAERLIPYTLELGGKAPAVVLEDADLDRASNAIVWGGFANSGQICASVERVYAVEPVYDALVQKVTDATLKLTVGEKGEVGSLTWPRQREIVEALVADAKQKGARVMTGGHRTGDPAGLYYAPTVLADCDHQMEVMKAEIFGPVVPMMKVKDAEEALRLANDSHLGLAGYLFTKDKEQARHFAERLEVGSVMVNDVLSCAGVPEMPWGGIKHSGLGVVRSDRGLKELSHARHINMDRVPPLERDPYWYPYTGPREKRIRSALKRLFDDSLGGKLLRKLLA